MDADSLVDAAAGSLKDVSPNIPDARRAEDEPHNLLVYVVIRLDVAAKAGADRC